MRNIRHCSLGYRASCAWPALRTTRVAWLLQPSTWLSPHVCLPTPRQPLHTSSTPNTQRSTCQYCSHQSNTITSTTAAASSSSSPSTSPQPSSPSPPTSPPPHPASSPFSSPLSPSASSPPSPPTAPSQPPVSPQLPLCRRPAVHIAPLREVLRWKQAMAGRIEQLGDAWEQLDGGPDRAGLMRELDWVLDDLIEAYRPHPSAPWEPTSWRCLEP
ncbi:hypothetical protein Agub_g12557, partial [Astrephomene gubernaculifera]